MPFLEDDGKPKQGALSEETEAHNLYSQMLKTKSVVTITLLAQLVENLETLIEGLSKDYYDKEATNKISEGLVKISEQIANTKAPDLSGLIESIDKSNKSLSGVVVSISQQNKDILSTLSSLLATPKAQAPQNVNLEPLIQGMSESIRKSNELLMGHLKQVDYTPLIKEFITALNKKPAVWEFEIQRNGSRGPANKIIAKAK